MELNNSPSDDEQQNIIEMNNPYHLVVVSLRL